jgi:hypothetical protein
MSKGISTTKLKKNIQSLPREKQRESIERFLRVLPQWIMDEVAKPTPNEKVIKYLESQLKMVRGLWTDYLIKHHVKGA